ncbi:MAG TPA: AbrB/MazE/SpoVT family DNA-binding domain-containing protein [Candidatus Nanoarchaeia archaeon]|nr:AbrB/MazE/SpoVT family DNA-binding domain-containing protein [Candidatus Nanoarchaeia archaeon]
MIELETVTRKWGNSLGITLPKDEVERQHIEENEKVLVLVIKKNQTPHKLFGMMRGKWNKTGQQIKDEIRAELHHG